MIKSRYNGIFLSIITIAGLTVSAYLVARDDSPLKGVKTQVHVVEEDPIANFVGTQLSRPQRTLETPVTGPLSRWSNREREHQDEVTTDVAIDSNYDGNNTNNKTNKVADPSIMTAPNAPVCSKTSTEHLPANSATSSQPSTTFTSSAQPLCSEGSSKPLQAASSAASQPATAFTSAAKPIYSDASNKHLNAASSTASQPATAFTSAAKPIYSEASNKHLKATSSAPSQPTTAFNSPADPIYSNASNKHFQASSPATSQPILAFTAPTPPLCSHDTSKYLQASSPAASQPTAAYTVPSQPICSEGTPNYTQASSPTATQPILPSITSVPTPSAKPVTATVGADLSAGKAYHISYDEELNNDPRLKPRIGAPIIKTQTRLSGASDLGRERTPIVETFEDEASVVAQHFVRPPRHHTLEEIAFVEKTPKEIAQAATPIVPPVTPATPATPPTAAPIPASRPREEAKEEALNNFLQQEAFINFNNVAFVQYLNFISKLTGKNFVFDEADLDFKVTIMSNKPTTIEFVMTALLQELRIHNLSLMEIGNTLIIHRNNTVNSLGTILGEHQTAPEGTELITQVFSLGNTTPSSLVVILQPMLSPLAILETSDPTNHLILTDIAPNVKKVAELIERLDTPFTGYEVGQHVVVNASLEGALQLVEKLMAPIAGETPITFIPHQPTNSIFVVSTRYLVERAMGVLEKIDNQEGQTRVLSIESNKASALSGAPAKAIPEAATLEFIRDFLKGMTPEQLANFLNQTNEQLENNPDLLRALQRLNLTDAQKEQLKRNALRLLGGLSQDEKNTLKLKGLEGLYPGIGIKPPSQPETVPAGLRKENELKQELQDDFDYLTPAERNFIINANNAQGQDQLGQVRSKLLDQEDFFFNNEPENRLGGRKQATRQSKKGNWQSDLPIGHVESTEFIVYKLDFRNGEEIVKALTEMATSLSNDITGDSTDLIASINSVQYIKSSNSLLITGTKRSLAKVRDIISQLDLPIKQVLIEMLLLQTSLNDSLNYGVDWGSRFGGTSSAGGQTFAGDGNTAFPATLSSVTGAEGAIPTDSYNFLSSSYSLGVIGRNIRRGPLVFDSIGALVSALHTDTISEVLMNPKVVVEDNASAEVFVGLNTAYATDVVTFGQSGSNNNTQQSIEFRDVGSSLKVTPRIGHNDVITLTIEQNLSDEVQASTGTGSSGSGSGSSATGSGTSTTSSVGPTTNKSSLKTIAHMPNGYFIILGGMIQANKKITNTQIPCLGGLPGLGGAFRSYANTISKSNLLIFIRPSIIEGEDINVQTKRQQDIIREKSRQPDRYQYEVDQALEYLNLQDSEVFIR